MYIFSVIRTVELLVPKNSVQGVGKKNPKLLINKPVLLNNVLRLILCCTSKGLLEMAVWDGWILIRKRLKKDVIL